MKIKYVWALLVALVIPLMVCAFHFPHLNEQIVDEANVLSPLQKEQIMQNLSGVSTQVVVASVRSLNGMEIEEYANRLFNHWQIGDVQTDDGILILIAPNQKQLRIEVGYGMEHILTDALAAQIVNQNMLPYVKQGNYGQALVDASLMVRNVLEGRALPVSSQQTKQIKINGTPIDDIKLSPEAVLRIGFGLLIMLYIFGTTFKKIRATVKKEEIMPRVLEGDIRKSHKERLQFACVLLFFSCFYGLFFAIGLFLMTEQILFGIFWLVFSTIHSLMMIYGRAFEAWCRNKYFPISAMIKASSDDNSPEDESSDGGISGGGFFGGGLSGGGGHSGGGFSGGGGRSGGGGSSGRW